MNELDIQLKLDIDNMIEKMCPAELFDFIKSQGYTNDILAVFLLGNLESDNRIREAKEITKNLLYKNKD